MNGRRREGRDWEIMRDSQRDRFIKKWKRETNTAKEGKREKVSDRDRYEEIERLREIQTKRYAYRIFCN